MSRFFCAVLLRKIAACVILTTICTMSVASTQDCPSVPPPSEEWSGSALHVAVNRGALNTVKQLANAKNVNEPDSAGNSPLIVALTSRSFLEPVTKTTSTRHAGVAKEHRAKQAIVTVLLEKGSDPNFVGARGETPLIALAFAGYEPKVDRHIAKALLRSGANVNARDATGSTALMLAASRGKVEVVKLLLEQGADVTVRNCAGKTALSLAEFEQRNVIVRLFRK
jgi:uncharacterized protein